MKANFGTDRAVVTLLFFLKLLSRSHAFVAPTQQVQFHHHISSTSLKALPEVNSFLLTDGLSAATYMDASDNAFSSMSGPLASLRTFFIVIAAAIFGITAIAYLTAAFLVPKAAEQLERDTRRLRPGLWEEYESKLEDGETMVNRPDLLQELGNIMQPIIVQEYEKEAAVRFDNSSTEGADSTLGGGSSAGSGGAAPTKGPGDVIDVTIVKPEEK
mmetsp:Transcript_12799/g.27212  ORF Transcript_12799/g.27212 Transcript_12799/m.27212 type:complete len:215 (-) Transcript_12799:486-1130(-)